MAQSDFSASWLLKLKKAGLTPAQIQAARDMLPRFADLVRPQAAADPIECALLDLATPAARLERELKTCLKGDDLVSHAAGELLRSSISDARSDNQDGFDLQAFQMQVDVFCSIVQRAIDQAPQVKKGRRPSLRSDMQAVRLIREAMRMAWLREEMQGCPMPKRDASEPHSSKKRGFNVAIDACVAAVGCKRSLASARKEVVAEYRMDEAIRADPSVWWWMTLAPSGEPPAEEN